MESVSETSSVSVLVLADQVHEQFERCLSSAAWAQQLVIGWTRVDQLTKAERFRIEQIFPGAEIIHLPGKISNFAATRNQLHKSVTSEWVFWLDSDEVILPECLRQIEQVTHNDELMGAMVHRQDVFAGQVLKWGEVRDVKILRLFRKSAGQFIRPVHEVAIVEGEIADPGIIIRHFAHQSISSFMTKIIHYSQLEAQLRFQSGRTATPAEIIIWPIGKFIQNMTLQLAFLDGWRGISYAVIMSLHSLAVRASLYEMNQHHDQQN